MTLSAVVLSFFCVCVCVWVGGLGGKREREISCLSERKQGGRKRERRALAQIISAIAPFEIEKNIVLGCFLLFQYMQSAIEREAARSNFWIRTKGSWQSR